MATSSYSNLFGTTGGGSELTSAGQLGSQQNPWQQSRQGSQAGISTMFGQQPRQRPADQQPVQTFAQLQRQGMARPAPQAPQAQPFARFGGSEQAMQARTGMLGQLQQQLAQPTRFDTQAFQQIRQAQAANLGAEYQAEQSRLNEELARRGLSASSVGGGRMGDLAGQQARALASLDAQLLQQAAQTQAQDRLAAMQAAGQFADLAGSQDLAQFEANRVAQAAEFAQGLQGAQFEQGQREFERGQALAAAQAQQAGGQAAMDLELRRQLGLGGLGIQQQEVDLRARQIQQEAQMQGRSLSIEEARLAAQQEQFGQGQQLERERLAAQQQQFGAQLGFNREELALRGELGRTEQQIAERRLSQEGRLQEAQQAIQLKELGQRQADAQAERTLRSALQERELTAQEKQQLRDIEARKEMQTAQFTQEAGQSQLERNLRERLQSGQISSQEKQQLNEINFRKLQLAQQAAESAGKVQVGTRIVYNSDGVPIGEEPIFEETVQSRQLEQQRRMQEAELTGKITINGVSVDTLASKTFDQNRLNALAEQAARQSQVSGVMHTVDKNGKIVQEIGPDGKPVSVEARRAQMEQENQQRLDRELRQKLGLAEYTGEVDGKQTIQSQQMQQKLLIDLAGVLAGSSAGVPSDLMAQLMKAFGLTPPPGDNDNNNNNNNNPPAGPVVGQLSPDGAYRWTGTGWVLNTPASGPAGEIDQKPPQA